MNFYSLQSAGYITYKGWSNQTYTRNYKRTRLFWTTDTIGRGKHFIEVSTDCYSQCSHKLPQRGTSFFMSFIRKERAGGAILPQYHKPLESVSRHFTTAISNYTRVSSCLNIFYNKDGTLFIEHIVTGSITYYHHVDENKSVIQSYFVTQTGKGPVIYLGWQSHVDRVLWRSRNFDVKVTAVELCLHSSFLPSLWMA